MVKVSIIVPVYGVEQYLPKCLDSLVNQTLKEIEIILVNDASPDHSDKVMREYQAKYPDIIKCIFLTENVRQGGARNRGIEVATGEYITFVDSDDYIDVTMCEKIYNKAKNNNSDIVCCLIKRPDLIKNTNYVYSYFDERILGELTEKKREVAMLSGGPVCAKLYKRELLIENNIRFPEKMKYEDTAIAFWFFLCAKRVDVVDEALYAYIPREGSTVHECNAEGHYDRLKAAEVILEKTRKIRETINAYDEVIEARCAEQGILVLKNVIDRVEGYDKNDLYKTVQWMNEKFPNFSDNKYFYAVCEPREIQIYRAASKSYEEFSVLMNRIEQETFSWANSYEINKQKIEKLLERYKAENKVIALWGLGDKGIAFLETFDAEREYISYVIQENSKIPCTNTGHRILSFSDVKEDVDFIIVTRKTFEYSVKVEANKAKKGVEVISIDNLLVLED